MKINKLIIFVLLVLAAGSCKNTTKKQAGNVENETQNPVADSIFTSPIRPDEKLQIGKVYTDTFEYVGYNNDYDYAYFIVQRNKKLLYLYDATDAPELYRGDLIKIQWQIDSSWIAGDNDRLEMNEFAKRIDKIKDGNVSLFRKKHAKPLRYTYTEEYSDGFFDKLYEIVEYYLANSKQDLILEMINNPDAEISYSIEKQKRDGENYIFIGISEYGKNSIIQWLYWDTENEIFEYDLPNDKLVKFE